MKSRGRSLPRLAWLTALGLMSGFTPQTGHAAALGEVFVGGTKVESLVVRNGLVFWQGDCSPAPAGPRIFSKPAGLGMQRTVYETSGCPDPKGVWSQTVAVDADGETFWVSYGGQVLRQPAGSAATLAPLLLTSMENAPSALSYRPAIGASASYVFWTETSGEFGDRGRILHARKSDGARFLLRDLTAVGGGGAVKLQAVDDNRVVYLQSLGTLAVERFSLVPLGWQRQVIATGVSGFTVANGSVYYAAVVAGGVIELRVTSLSGLGGAVVIHTIPATGFPQVSDVAASTKNLFWHELRGTAGPLMRRSLIDGSVTAVTDPLSQGPIWLAADERHVFWRHDGETIRRLSVGGAAITYDLAADGLEVVQAVQSGANDVPLVHGKTTHVRLFGRIASSSSGATSVRAWPMAVLHGEQGGAPLPGSPLRPISDEGSTLVYNRPADRNLLSEGFLFRLPQEWTTRGAVTLRGELNPAQVIPESNRANNQAAFTATFVRKAPICVIVHPLRTTRGIIGGSWSADAQRHFDAAELMLPTSEIDVYWPGGSPLEESEDIFGLGPYELDDDMYSVAIKLWRMNTFGDDPDRCDDLNALTHRACLFWYFNGAEARGFSIPGDVFLAGMDATAAGINDPRGAATVAHELGHNYDRDHVDCPLGVPDDPDPDYPYGCDFSPGSHRGFQPEQRKIILGGDAGDLMSYRRSRWISDYTWRAIFDEIELMPADSAGRLIEAEPAFNLAGARQPSLVLVQIKPTGIVSLPPVVELPDVRSLARANRRLASPAGESGSLLLAAKRADGSVAANFPVTTWSVSDGAFRLGAALVTLAPAVTRLEVVRANDPVGPLAVLVGGGGAPTVKIVNPTAGLVAGARLDFRWSGSDPEGRELRYVLRYSADLGVSWRVLQEDTPFTELSVATSELPGGVNTCLFQVLASDGLTTTTVTSAPFTVSRKAPLPRIFPETARGKLYDATSVRLAAGEEIILHGQGLAAEDGDLSAAGLTWQLARSPAEDVPRTGTGKQWLIRDLRPGTYVTTLTATDGAGMSAQTNLTIFVDAKHPGVALSEPVLDGFATESEYETDHHPLTLRYANGLIAQVRMVRTGESLYFCVAGLSNGPDPKESVGVAFDPQNDGTNLPQANDLRLRVFADGQVLGERGDGAGFTNMLTLGGADARVSRNGTTWTVELRLNVAMLGAWDGRTIGMDVAHYRSASPTADVVRWFASGDVAWNSPANWADVALGDYRADPWDGDGDRLPDQWEREHFNTLARDGTGDFDQDGQTDAAEFAAGTNPTAAASLHLIPAGSTWNYLSAGENLGAEWRRADYDDSEWSSGPGRLGFGGDGERTVLPSGMTTYYFRNLFTLQDASAASNLLVHLKRDDGAIVYLNGYEVFRSNMPTGAITHLTLASTAATGSDETNVFLSPVVTGSILQSGPNIVAVEVHQSTANSADLGFDLELFANVPALTSCSSNLLVNGSFELPGATNGYEVLPGSSTHILGWTTLLNGVEYYNPPLAPRLISSGRAAEGNYLLDLAPGTFIGGGVEQTFTTIPGRTYHVGFAMGTAKDWTQDGTASLTATVAGISHYFSVATTNAYIVWERKSFDFVATAMATTLAFSTTNDPSSSYVNLDDVRVSDCCIQLACPGSMLTACSGNGEAIVSFAVFATNHCDPGNLAVECVPAAGSTFPVGTTTVQCTATGSGQTAQCSFEVTVEPFSQTKLTVNDPVPGREFAFFGASVAIDGNTVVAGNFVSGDLSFVGAAYIYDLASAPGTPPIKLAPADDTRQYGFDVAMQGSIIAVAAPEYYPYRERKGSVYVYARAGGTWVLDAKLTASDGGLDDAFGTSVAIDGDTIVVGASGNGEFGINAGAAYVFVRGPGGWTQQAKLNPDDAAADTYIGNSVAISGNTIVVGAPGNYQAPAATWKAGKAYVFTRTGTTWTQQQRLVSPDGFIGDTFGYTVAADGDNILISAPHFVSQNSLSRAAYVFSRSAGRWSLGQRFQPPVINGNEYFGLGLAILGGRLAIGSPRVGTVSGGQDSAFVYRWNGITWAHERRLFPTDGARDVFLGRHLDFGGSSLAASALGDRHPGGTRGSVYVFDSCDSARCLRIKCPTNIVVPCQGANGTAVYYTVTATNECGAHEVGVFCVPSSGRLFSPGITTVTCTASSSNETWQCSFMVTVLSPNCVGLNALQADSIALPDLHFEENLLAAGSFRVPHARGVNVDTLGRSLDFLGRYRDLYGLRDPMTELYLQRRTRDALGAHLFFGQVFDGIPVFGAALAVHSDATNTLGSNGRWLLQGPSLPLPPPRTARQAEALARQAIAGQGLQVIGDTRLFWFNRSLLSKASNVTYLTWRVNLRGTRIPDGNGSFWTVLIDAHDGTKRWSQENLMTDSADKDFDIEGVYNSSSDTCWELSSIDDEWFDEDGPTGYPGEASDAFLDGAQAFDYAHQTYDYFFNTFHRHSWDDDEEEVEVMVHVDRNWYNAAYSSFCDHIKFGDGWVTLDLFAHEFTHGVTDSTADLEYEDEPGALNESFSDVFAVLVDSDDWLIGEDLPRGAIRDLSNPPAFGDPDHYDRRSRLGDDADRNEGNDWGGVHFNSGIPNKAAFLIIAGGTHSGITVTGIGRAKAQRLYYDVLTSGLTCNSQMRDLRNVMVARARDYLTAHLYGFTAENVCTVINAFAAVGLGDRDSDCDGIEDPVDADHDGDGVPIHRDNCPDHFNPGQSDLDHNGVGDACDPDIDGDGVLNENDNCPRQPNPGQEDWDGNGIGDVCDDADHDGIRDAFDNCRTVANRDQRDLDRDGVGDACDLDIDGDGIFNAFDNSPLVPNRDQRDTDGDGIGDVSDNAPNDPNPDQRDTDGDGLADVIDPDDDGDGTLDTSDPCPLAASLGVYVDLNHNGIPFECDLMEQDFVSFLRASRNLEGIIRFTELQRQVRIPIPPCRGPCPDPLPEDLVFKLQAVLPSGVELRLLDDAGAVVAKSHSMAGGGRGLRLTLPPAAGPMVAGAGLGGGGGGFVAAGQGPEVAPGFVARSYYLEISAATNVASQVDLLLRLELSTTIGARPELSIGPDAANGPGLIVRVAGTPSRTYRLERSRDLKSWQEVRTASSPDGVWTHALMPGEDANSWFYRAVLGP